MTPKEIAQLIVDESATVKNLNPVSRIHIFHSQVSNEIMKLILKARDREEDILHGRTSVFD